MAELDFRVKNGIVVGANSATFGTAASIAANGNVGIANSVPTNKLSVNGSAFIQGALNVNTGINFTDTVVTSNTDLSKHIDLWGGTYGFNIMSNLLNINSNQNIIFRSNGTERFKVNSSIIQSASNTTTLGTAFYITDSGNVGISNTAPIHKLRVDGDISLSGAIHANGSVGAAGHVLLSNGSASYWAATPATGVTSVASGDGLTGGPITATGTLSVLANTGLVANTTGLHVNSTYLGTQTSNNALFLGGVAAADYQTEAGLAANVAVLTSNNSTFAFGKTEGNLNVNSSIQVLANNGILSNTSGVFVRANTGLIANTTGLFVNANTGLVGNATGIHVNSAYINTISSNSAAFLTGTIAAGTNTNIVYYTIGSNDYFRIQTGGAADAGFVEFATADGSNEPIYFRQYTGVFATLTRTLTLLDSAGNTLVPGDIIPVTDNTKSLGNTSFRWANIYTGDFHLSNEGSEGNVVDGTTGNWTIQEGKDDLFILNNKTGKKYKFKLEEII